ncbi:Ribosomal RNA small subunit methyltransferase G [Tritonibacter multivorans]|uniref:Ribosomal RNA small subunit methyltransferase G n=1 Tax=Tritonibacter multivorans TaxID=928856 RepID=A0A0P1GDS0_9RHOB|nr:16S rRNA (guanine(527)-N(7))-methyltransferase RsmG [Tritonibacter multivorans]MDA7420086.1 16S rRNA (guanine(527)-N(7))-methyltransferase RsmG [Tritonibacter multivorans]CUH79658.1 Ribosomal RNA small subunit methyltransferase G [Tritonibacter multivorans]SFC05121.1 16S rRNA (guanine527-N7)-methyltransferase [Tritonibacter multivorans]
MTAALNVSRETMERLKTFDATLQKWNPRINLVSKSTIPDLWTRHILDSIQVFEAITDPKGHWVDIGSGGGLPGVIVAICAADKAPDLSVTLIESDQRKSAFLRTAARECGVKINVISERIEAAAAQSADILSARALADLSQLCEFSERHLKKDGVCIFPKGGNWKKEVDNALQQWRFEWEAITSLTEPQAVILKMKGVERV